MKLYTALLCVLVLCVGAAPLSAQTSAPYFGVQLLQEPLPTLLTKHLPQLKSGHGVLIQNILVDGPADKAGLDKDDIIVTFDGQPVTDYQELSETIQAAEVGRDVTVGVIQFGVKKDVIVRLEARPAGRNWGQWKYLPQADSSQILRHRIFRLDPDTMDFGFPGFPAGQSSPFSNLIEQFSASCVYHYQHSLGADQFTVSIEGNPEEADTTVTVKAGDDEYQATIGTIDQLPEKFREAVLEDIEKSKDYKVDFKGQEIEVPFKGNFNFEAFTFPPGEIDVPDLPTTPKSDVDKRFEQLEEQLEKLEKQWQRQFERLEKMLSRKLEVSA